MVKIQCSKCQKIIKTLIRNIFQNMYCRAHKTASLTPIQHTVRRQPPCTSMAVGMKIKCIFWKVQLAKCHPHQPRPPRRSLSIQSHRNTITSSCSNYPRCWPMELTCPDQRITCGLTPPVDQLHPREQCHRKTRHNLRARYV